MITSLSGLFILCLETVLLVDLYDINYLIKPGILLYSANHILTDTLNRYLVTILSDLLRARKTSGKETKLLKTRVRMYTTVSMGCEMGTETGLQ